MSVPAPQFATPHGFHPAHGGLPQPLTFEGHAGWLHVPAGPNRREIGVLLVAPPGRDGRCVYRPLRDLAEGLAASGFSTLRFDLLGVGESLDPDGDPDLWPLWLQGVKAAAEALKAAAGVNRVVLGGMRLGASLAALTELDNEGLVLMAPVVSGRQWLRELKLAGSMSQTGAPAGSEAVEADGLFLSPATVAGVGALDLKRLERAPERVLIAAQGASGAVVAERLAELGSAVTLNDFPGYEALLEDTHSNLSPTGVFADVVAWLDAAFPRITRQDVAHLDLAAEPTSLHPPGAVEHAVHFGHGLSGVLCLPQAAADGRAVIFCNTSGEPKAGIGRFAVTAARTLAQAGVASLRFDFTGIGDSEGLERGHMYETSRLTDFAAAITLIASEGSREIVVVGVCSGAHHALHTLIEDPRVTGAFVVSPKLVWRSGESLAPEIRDTGRATGAYVDSLRDPATWRRLLAGGIDVKAVLGTLTKRLGAKLGARLKDEGGHALREGLAAASERGARAHLLMGVDDASLDELETYFGRGGARLAALPGMSVRVNAGLDHGLSRKASRDVALAELMAFMAAD